MGSGSSRNLADGADTSKAVGAKPAQKGRNEIKASKPRIPTAAFPNKAVVSSPKNSTAQRSSGNVPHKIQTSGVDSAKAQRSPTSVRPQAAGNTSKVPRGAQTNVTAQQKDLPLTKENDPKSSQSALARREEQEEMSIDQALAQQFKAYEAQQEKLRMLEQAEDASLQQQELQQYKAFAAAQDKIAAKGEQELVVKRDKGAIPDVSRGARREFPTTSYSSPKASKVKKQIIFSPDSGTQEERNTISEVVPGKLYLTNFRGVGRPDELEALGIKHIVCVNEQDNDFPDRFNYFNVDNLEDQEDHDASVHFESVTKFTDKALAQGGAACFHCAAGISRSSTMMIAYLMASRRMSLLDAFTLTYNARRVTWPNRTFMMQLIQYERKLQGKGKLLGKGPSLTLEQWDAWNVAGDEQGSKEASLSERTASLRGRESLQFRTYQDSVRNSISTLEALKEK